jgi:hypothetical protein
MDFGVSQAIGRKVAGLGLAKRGRIEDVIEDCLRKQT